MSNSSQILRLPENLSAEFKQYCLKLTRIAALGYLSSAITHELGNALTVISGQAQLIRLKGPNQTVDQILTRTEGVLGQIARAEIALNRVGSFGTRLKGQEASFSPQKGLRNAIFAFEQSCVMAGIHIQAEISTDEIMIHYDQSQLEFTLLELLHLFLLDPVFKGDLLIQSNCCGDSWVVRAELKEFEPQEDLEQGFWSRTEIEQKLLGTLVALEQTGGTVSLSDPVRTRGWELSIPIELKN